ESARGGRGLRCRLGDERKRADVSRSCVCCPSGEIGDRRDWSLLEQLAWPQNRNAASGRSLTLLAFRLVAKGQMGHVRVQLLNTDVLSHRFRQLLGTSLRADPSTTCKETPRSSRSVSPLKRIHRAGDAFVHRP